MADDDAAATVADDGDPGNGAGQDPAASLRARSQLEEVIGSIASDLLAVDPGGIVAGIEAALGRLGRHLGADRAYLLRTIGSDLSRGRDLETDLLEWSAPGAGARRDDLGDLGTEARAWWLDVMRREQVLHVLDVREHDDASAAHAMQVLRRQGVRSLLVVPLPLRPRHAGFMGLVTVHEPRAFDARSLGLLRVAGEILLSALERADAAARLRAATQALSRRNADLERSNQELERFAHAAAHDMRAPLARVEMALAVLRNRLPDDAPDAGELIAIAARGAEMLRTMIDDLLVHATVDGDAGDPEEVDLDGVLVDVLGFLQPAIDAAGAVITTSPLGSVRGHVAPLNQLLQNLLANAIRFRHEHRSPRIEVTAEPVDDGIVLSVVDDGIGIDPADREAVFAMFTRLHPGDRYAGSGIGLATCAKVVAKLGGRIWIDDGIDGGIAVRAHLPTG